ncbi:AGE family epimerase/isomerase [Vibrio harveyi]|uniref:AGE family epimerase/isomerase n=1 Tax=Vibrio harveyi TaxID=669 RepID=UPI00165DCFCF|nr:AGE family epimerase/isomerase [Vibrio harveyi]ELY1985745.1 AGE family epimerase/isomerase [Vibrio harveyi]
MSFSTKSLIIAFSLATSSVSLAATIENSASNETVSQDAIANNAASTTFPSTQTWLNHITTGLAPYWMDEKAYGEPVGNFPTFRCNDGRKLNTANVCPELDRGWITPYFGREYTRMKSRQTYAYGVLFHLTGDTQALELAKQGAYYLINELQDKAHGGFISFTQNKQAGLKWTQRTSQDQAYALVGLAMYYYLTGDHLVEKVLIDQQKFIFDNYRLNDEVGLAWVLQDGDEQSAKQHELVAQLDQINGYMLLVAPLLPEPHRTKWLSDLTWLTNTLVQHYHSDKEQRFYGAIHHKVVMQPNAKHNDFGHTIKAYWMTYLVAEQINNADWKQFAKQGMRTTLERAQYQQQFEPVSAFFSPELQSEWANQSIPAWQSRPYSNGSSSWEWAELDQSAMTLAILDNKVGNVLPYTTRTFMDAWVDHQYGGVGLDPKSTKAFHWGNGYHQFEHALIGTLTSGALNHQPVTLYYANASKGQSDFTPYYFQGKVDNVERTVQGEIQAVTYSNITP